jgi:hypothetical protein
MDEWDSCETDDDKLINNPTIMEGAFMESGRSGGARGGQGNLDPSFEFSRCHDDDNHPAPPFGPPLSFSSQLTFVFGTLLMLLTAVILLLSHSTHAYRMNAANKVRLRVERDRVG